MPQTPYEQDKSSERVESETDLIQTYLAPLACKMPGAFGLRDDAALLSPEPGTDIVLTTDPIIAGVHFLPSDHPGDIAWKALAVNVSDLAAKGAEPLAYLLTLALPQAPKRAWMAAFAQGLAAAQKEFGCHLIGGDTDRTPGPLSIGVTAIGTLPAGAFVPRQGAAAGDHVFVTGTLGDAAVGLALHRDPELFANALTEDDRKFLIDRYLRPKPRIALCQMLRAYASAALDISDGLLKDLVRLAGPLGITLQFEALPLSPPLRTALAGDARIADAVLAGGDDYELLIAVPPNGAEAFAQQAAHLGVFVSNLGVLQDGLPITVLGHAGTPIEAHRLGYDHFAR